MIYYWCIPWIIKSCPEYIYKISLPSSFLKIYQCFIFPYLTLARNIYKPNRWDWKHLIRKIMLVLVNMVTYMISRGPILSIIKSVLHYSIMGSNILIVNADDIRKNQILTKYLHNIMHNVNMIWYWNDKKTNETAEQMNILWMQCPSQDNVNMTVLMSWNQFIDTIIMAPH